MLTLAIVGYTNASFCTEWEGKAEEKLHRSHLLLGLLGQVGLQLASPAKEEVKVRGGL